MNARSTTFEFTCLGKKVTDITTALFHSIVFNRTFGKIHHESESKYSIGTLGFEEIICDYIDFTYLRVASSDLVRSINRDIRTFTEALRSAAYLKTASTSPSSVPSSPSSYHFDPYHSPLPSPHSLNDDLGYLNSPSMVSTGTISLEFFLKTRSNTSFLNFSEPLVWEVWSLKFNCLKDDSREESFNNSSIEDQLFDKVLSIVSSINHGSYLPEMPAFSEVENVFDTSYALVQPYNFKISYKIGSGETKDASVRPGLERNTTQHVIKNFLKQKLAL